jgi:hypothetical protein
MLLASCACALIECGFERARINLEQHVALMDRRALTIVLADQIARNVRLDLGIHVAIERGNPFAGYGHISLPND